MSCPRLTNYFQVLYFRYFDMGLIYWHIRSRRTCVQFHAFFFYISPGVSISCCARFIFLCFLVIFACVFWSQHFLLLQIHISVPFGYICMRFTSPPRLHHLPYWTFHPYSHTSSYLKNKSIIQQQHSHSMVFVIFSIEFTQHKNKTCLRIFTVMLFDQQLQPQIIL